jgi:peptide/nickel transport system substrate-binding protein
MKKKSRSKIFLSVMVLLVSVALCACGGDKNTESSENSNSSSEQTTESTAADETESVTDASEASCFVFGMTQEVSSVDPHMDTDAATRGVLFNVFEGLVKPTSTGDLIPAVASEYTISDDACVYTFTLRDGITFQDGNPVTVEDVKYSLERSAELDGESSALSVISDITLVDDKTIEITLSEANSEFIYNLTIAVLEEANDANQSDNPIGTGPFKITEFVEGQYLKLEKYDGYWQSEVEGFDGNYIDEAKFKFIADAQTAYLELQAGTIDALQYLTIDQIDTLSDDYNVVESTMMLVHGFFLNNEYGPLQDVRVRQALNYAVDRDAINEFLFGGKSPIIQTHAYPTITAWYNADTEGTYTYDVEKAKELLADAGYADGFDLEITVPSSYTQHVNTAEIIAEQLSQVGVNVTINLVEWSSWLSDVYSSRDYQSTIIGFDISSLSPATWYKRYYTTSSNDFTNFSNEEYDSIYEQAKASVDYDEKYELYGKLQQILTDEAASVFIEDPADFIAINKKYTGYTTYPVSAIDLSLVKLAE